MENEHELGYETLTRVYLGSYEHYKGVGAEVEHPEPGFELIAWKWVVLGSISTRTPCIFTPRLQFLQAFTSQPFLMILESYGSKGLLPYGFERGDSWCKFEWRYKGAIYNRLELGRVSKPHDLVLTHGRAS
ncbi:hypothetical protein Tco_0301495 [Tanacetum coccineum]